jgi:hypothetical protein
LLQLNHKQKEKVKPDVPAGESKSK